MASDTMRALEERGEKLGQVNVKAQEMEVAAHTFADTAKRLKEQQQKRAGWL